MTASVLRHSLNARVFCGKCVPIGSGRYIYHGLPALIDKRIIRVLYTSEYFDPVIVKCIPEQKKNRKVDYLL